MSKVWLITGSSRGLGLALAEAALAAGDSLVATARCCEPLHGLSKRYGNRVRIAALDVTDEATIYAAIDTALAHFGRIDVVVNNAGYGGMAEIENIPDEEFRAQFETNFFGLVNVTRAALPILREQGAGHFIQIGSAGGRQGTGTAGFAAYQSAKFAVEGFSEVLAKEVAPLGIAVTIVEPGSFRTDWAGSSMTVAKISTPYQVTVGVAAAQLKQRNGRQNGDPAKAAQAILQIAEMDSPPLRLLLGSDAVQRAEQAAAKQAVQDHQWQPLSLSTDFLTPVREPFKRSTQRVCRHEAA